MKRTFLASLACLALVACQPGTPAPEATPAAPSASPSAPAVATGACELTATAMYAAEAAYNAPAAAYVAADGRELLSPAVKAKAKPLLTEAYDLLKQARLFYSARNAVGFCGSTTSLKSVSEAALALLPVDLKGKQ